MTAMTPDVSTRELFTGRSSGGHTKPLELLATLLPGFPHFATFASDPRLSGIRINPAMLPLPELERELALLGDVAKAPVPLWYDVKGRQLRVEETRIVNGHLECRLNHPIVLDLRDDAARRVIFKAGGDFGTIDHIEDDKWLIFRDGTLFGPHYRVGHGESLNIRHPSLFVDGPTFTEDECRKIEAAKRAGFTRFFLSYVEGQFEIDRLLELVGKQDAEVWLKIENERGLEFVTREFKKRDNLVLVAARGDLYVEIERPHEILNALRLIITKDPEACVGSRILLSVARRPLPPHESREAFVRILEAVRGKGYDAAALRELLVTIYHDPVPSCADFSELAWLYDLGYRRMLLCDELCLDGTLLGTALNAFEAFRASYCA